MSTQTFHRLVGSLLLLACAQQAAADSGGEKVRFATFNVSLHRREAGAMSRTLKNGQYQPARRIAEIIQRVRPDVLLVNEIDYDEQRLAAARFHRHYLGISQNGQSPIQYPHRFVAPVNSGVPTGIDLNRDGKSDGPEDAFGFGRHPGQYGMAVYSKYPIDRPRRRTFQKFLWKDMPDALLPVDPKTTEPFYGEEQLARFRLSSKSHWDVPLIIGERTVHFLVCHPTPPVFDGVEDRNGRRNHDEIRFWADYIDAARGKYIYDDQGQRGGLDADAHFVIAGDLNADPQDGGSTNQAARQLTEHSLIAHDVVPASQGGVEQSKRQGKNNQRHRGDPAHDTADFRDSGPGNLRVDYVLPSRNLMVVGAGVYWPRCDEEGFELVGASDHRLVWVDVKVPP